MELKSIKYYQGQLENYTLALKSLNSRLFKYSMWRLVVFIVTLLSLYFTFQIWQLALGIGIIGIVLFVFLLSKYTDIKYQRDLHKKLVFINEEELKIASGDYFDRNDGAKFQDSTHFYSLDIDLFGKGSFFQFLNRTTINEGTLKLANALKANSITQIRFRQKAIKELADKATWRQHFSAVATLIRVETPAEKIISWLKDYHAFLPQTMKWLPNIFSLSSILVVMLSVFQIIPPSIVGYWLLLGLAITGKYLKKVNVLASNTDKVKDTFKQYATLLNKIENETFTSDLLKEKQRQIESEHKKASEIFSNFSKHLDALDNRNNIFSAIFGNGFLLVDLKNTYKIEKWISSYHTTVSDWFDVVSYHSLHRGVQPNLYKHQTYFPSAC